VVTINQLFLRKRLKKKKWSSSVKLEKSPFKQGLVSVVFVGSPKKPNSGKRKLAKISLNTGRRAVVTIPDGAQHGGVSLQKYDRVLIRGGRCQDVPGVHYKILRTSSGRVNDTLGGSFSRKQKRSKFGVFKPTKPFQLKRT